jgi:hypothetical protein
VLLISDTHLDLIKSILTNRLIIEYSVFKSTLIQCILKGKMMNISPAEAEEALGAI